MYLCMYLRHFYACARQANTYHYYNISVYWKGSKTLGGWLYVRFDRMPVRYFHVISCKYLTRVSWGSQLVLYLVNINVSGLSLSNLHPWERFSCRIGVQKLVR